MQQPDAIELTAELEFKAIPYDQEQTILGMVSLRAAPIDLTDLDNCAHPVRMCLTIDTSGSMKGKSLEMAIEAVIMVIRQLRPIDQLAVVTFNNFITVIQGFTTMTPETKEILMAKIKVLRAGGCTHIESALNVSLALFAEGESSQDHVSSLILMTDGNPTAGMTTLFELTGLIETRLSHIADPHRRPSVVTMGLGDEHKEELLRALSVSGKGNYYYLKDGACISEAFGDCLGGMWSTQGTHMLLCISAHNSYTIPMICGDGGSFKFVSTSSEAPWINVKLELPDICAEETRDIVFKISVPAHMRDPGFKEQILTVGLEYSKPGEDKPRTIMTTACLLRPETSENQTPNVKINEQVNRLESVEVIENAQRMASSGAYDEAMSLLSASETKIAQSPSRDSDMCKALIKTLKQCQISVSSREHYEGSGSKSMSATSESYSKQRSNLSRSREAPSEKFDASFDRALEDFVTPSKIAVRSRMAAAASFSPAAPPPTLKRDAPVEEAVEPLSKVAKQGDE